MEYRELKEQVDASDGAHRKELKRALTLAAIGGNVRPQFQRHLEQATTYQEFFDGLYEDDECRFERSWALWARLGRKDWLGRFTPERKIDQVYFTGRGLTVELAGGSFLVPMAGRVTTVYLFDQGSFNEGAAEYFTSLDGKFSCAGMEFEGAYDIYRTHGAVLFERWHCDEDGRREGAVDLPKRYRRNG